MREGIVDGPAADNLRFTIISARNRLGGLTFPAHRCISLQGPSRAPLQLLQAGFGLLLALLDVLPGSLSSRVQLVISTSKYVLSQPPTTSTSTLHLTFPSFLAFFFRHSCASDLLELSTRHHTHSS